MIANETTIQYSPHNMYLNNYKSTYEHNIYRVS